MEFSSTQFGISPLSLSGLAPVPDWPHSSLCLASPQSLPLLTLVSQFHPPVLNPIGLIEGILIAIKV